MLQTRRGIKEWKFFDTTCEGDDPWPEKVLPYIVHGHEEFEEGKVRRKQSHCTSQCRARLLHVHAFSCVGFTFSRLFCSSAWNSLFLAIHVLLHELFLLLTTSYTNCLPCPPLFLAIIKMLDVCVCVSNSYLFSSYKWITWGVKMDTLEREGTFERSFQPLYQWWYHLILCVGTTIEGRYLFNLI